VHLLIQILSDIAWALFACNDDERWSITKIIVALAIIMVPTVLYFHLVR
jgi:hypothetical protein